MTKIDIIVPYVDENDKEWQKDFKAYKEKEIKAGIQKPSNTQAFAEERIRDWDNFRYWFRAVEKNCPWVNKVFLVVQRESQIPTWINRDNPKLRIVYHKEFIPEELLPTFSTLVIETFYYRIPDLSENFIVCNDDFYFLNPIPEDLFFKDGKIYQGTSGMRPKNWNNGNSDWSTIVNNNNVFLEKYIIKEPKKEFYHYSHLPDGRVKSFEVDFMNKYYDVIYDAMKVSRFRHPKNFIPSVLYIDTMKYTGYGILSDRVYKNSAYVAIDSRTNISEYKDCEMICFNDTACVDDFEKCRDNLLSLFKAKFPEKSSFEKDAPKEKFRVCFGIPSWFPEAEPGRGKRQERLNKLFRQITDLFGDVDWLVVAQNWHGYKVPDYIKNIKIREKPQLGILKARKELRKFFLEEGYDYLVMLDDDVILETKPEFTREYFFDTLRKNPFGFVFLQYSWSLTFCAVSRYIYSREDMVDIDPQKGEGYEDMVFPYLLHYKYPMNEFKLKGIKFTQHVNNENKAPSTWMGKGIDHKELDKKSWYHIRKFEKGDFKIDKKKAQERFDREKWVEEALYRGWINKADVDKYLKD